MKTKLNLHETILFRIPQFPLTAKLEDCWDELKISIANASPDFFELIKDLSYTDIAGQSIAVQITIAKYFNRARFRATPYGTFAGFGVCALTENDQDPIVIDPKPIRYDFPDWACKEEFADLWKSKPERELILFANTSYYLIGDQIRYVYKDGTDFDLSDINQHPAILRLLRLCQRPLPYHTVVQALEPECLDEETIKSLVSDLIDAQLLLTNFHPNIIGAEFFQRTKAQIQGNPKLYTITEYQRVSGGLQHKALNQIQQLIPLLHNLVPRQQSNSYLLHFIRQFSKQYDQREIPVMTALDPEIGIGYGNLESSQEQSALVKAITGNKKDGGEDANENKLKHALMGKINEDRSAKVQIIKLEELDIHLSEDLLPLPNTFSALFALSDDHILLDHLGGATANTLLGRFSIAGEEICKTTKEMARVEQEANPDVLFFDIAYTGEVLVDNVNRRAAIYDFQLSILNYDCSENPLVLQDMYLKVNHDELILFSRKHGKRLIPRISTAYNYNRSDLSLFRLLCDLQHHKVQSALIPTIEQAMPALSQYPRLQYKDIILSPAKWEIEYHKTHSDPDTFRKYLADLNLPTIIKLGGGDQTLQLDLSQEFDLTMLASILKAKKTLWIRESFETTKPQVLDNQGKSYASEYVLSLIHHEQVYRKYLSFETENKPETRRLFAPGSEWVFYEIYCHSSRADELIKKELPVIWTQYASLLRSWFFIRYNENGDHLRLRFQLRDPSAMSTLMQAMAQTLQPLLENGMVSSTRICCYQREIEKYGAELYPAVEAHFHTDSRFAVTCIQAQSDVGVLYQACHQLMEETGKAVFEDRDMFARLIHNLCQAHNKEHQMNSNLFKMLNKEFSEFKKTGLHELPAGIADLLPQLLESFIYILKLAESEKRAQLFADLFHMHINRLFAAEQRVHEMIIYNYLVKKMKTAQHLPLEQT